MINLRTLFNRKPKPGDKVSVAVGFNPNEQKGIVSSVHDSYCWIDMFKSNGEFLKSFTASFSYCKFKYL